MPSVPLPTAALPSSAASAAFSASADPSRPASLVVAGVLAVDITMQPSSTSPLQTTASGTVSLTLGGVAGNVASAAHSLLSSQEKDDVLLVAPVADDLHGGVAKSGLAKRGMRHDGLVSTSTCGTATCGILLDEKGDLVGGVADMGIASELSGKKVSPASDSTISTVLTLPDLRLSNGYNLRHPNLSALTATCRRTPSPTSSRTASSRASQVRCLADAARPTADRSLIPSLF